MSTLQQRFSNHYSDAPERLQAYEIPERGEPGKAAGLLLPASESEVGEMLRTANETGARLVISSGRTGLVEAQRPEGEIVLSLEKLQQPLSFSLADGRSFDFETGLVPEAHGDALAAWWRDAGKPSVDGASILVEGAMAVDALNQILAPIDLMFPMEMGSSSAATVGACVANASAGANAVCYGTAAHMCVSASGYWGNGEPSGNCSAASWRLPATDTLAIDSASVNTAWGLIGSQGAFGVITQVRLRTFPVPMQREAAMLPVADMPAAMRILSAARAAFPGEVEEYEFIGRSALQLVRGLRGDAFRWPFETDPGAPIFVLLQLKTPDPNIDLAARLYEFLAGELELQDEQIGYAPLPVLRAIRHSITEASNHRMRELGGGRLSFDTATPVAVFGDYLAGLQAQLEADFPQIQLIAFGHAGVGGAHLHLLGTRESPVKGSAAALIRRVIDVTLAHGGTFSAEHGIGPKWAEEYAAHTAPETLEGLLGQKRRLDPNNVLNPRSFGFDRLLK